MPDLQLCRLNPDMGKEGDDGEREVGGRIARGSMRGSAGQPSSLFHLLQSILVVAVEEVELEGSCGHEGGPDPFLTPHCMG